MSVHGCGRGCGRQIYVSMVPGGGAPVSLPNASKYTPAALYCQSCREYICVSCASRPPGLSPMHDCASCGTQLSYPGVHGVASSGGSSTASGEPIARSAAAASSRAAMQQTSGPSNGPAMASLFLAGIGSMCCLLSAVTPSGCFGFFINLAAIVSGATGLLKARATGVGMIPALIGLALGLFNLLISMLLSLVYVLASM